MRAIGITLSSPYRTMWYLKDFLKRVDSLDLDGENRKRARLLHTERMERFKNAILKQREETNDRMAEMFGHFRELKISKAPKKVLIKEETKSPNTKKVNSISLTRGEEERNDKDNVTAGNDINGTDTEMPVKEAEMENEAENRTKNKPIKKAENKEIAEAPSS
ncbi:hypothetical protein Tco_1014319 [Tanacetum coccineum]